MCLAVIPRLMCQFVSIKFQKNGKELKYKFINIMITWYPQGISEVNKIRYYEEKIKLKKIKQTFSSCEQALC